MKIIASFVFLLIFGGAYAQQPSPNYQTKRVAVKDTIQIDSVSINPSLFNLKTKEGLQIDTSYYTIDFAKALLIFTKPVDADTVSINYLNYPNFITRQYTQLDPRLIVDNTDNIQQLYRLQQSTVSRNFTPFDGLTTSGSISRGVTVGNNQNSVLNSELDLQISGKLSDKVSLRASIQDANIPLQESGYSQRLDEFDQVFIELFSDDWRVRAGDIDLVNDDSYFANFTKRVQGLLVEVNLDNDHSNANIFAAGALAKGQFTTSQFTAQEGNQGPYKLRGSNNELYVLVVSGSETVYVNGSALKRGENQDYIIDYNAGEIIFNATFPVTSEMRITVDYQYSERNFSRFTAFGGGGFETDKFKIGASVYSETDSKNQPLQQNLSPDQVQILANAGDDPTLMVAPSGVPEVYNENRILYRKDFDNGTEIYVFSNNPEDDLFSVKFRLLGANEGDYVLVNSNAVSNIYAYIAPISGKSQGNYAPIVQLIAPTKLQVAVVNGTYKPTERTELYFEAAGSKNDLNLFSDLDDEENDGFAGKLLLKQHLIRSDSLWNVSAILDADVMQKDFKTIQRLYNAEFSRDWNLEMPLGNQSLLTAGLELYNPLHGFATYKYEHLSYSENFVGNRHSAIASLKFGRWQVFTNTSILKSASNSSESEFFRTFNRITYNFQNQWLGTKVAAEDNAQRDLLSDQLTPLSQRFKSAEVFYGIGDSTHVFLEVGYKHRLNDSLQLNRVENVSTSRTYYLKSKIIQNTATSLGVFINYRNLKSVNNSVKNEQSLNSRITFNQQLADQLVQWHTVFETNSGSLPQQDFTYVKVEPGQGAYTWIDYNDNGIQELNEFEIAQFQDQGAYIRVLLPHQVFIKTHQNRLSQTVTINPQQWAVGATNFKKFWSHFYNQMSYLVDRKIKKEFNTFDFNPFEDNDAQQLALQKSVRNVLFFNRGKQNYTTSYTFLNSSVKTLLSTGFQQHDLKSHQLNFNHKFAESWLLNFITTVDENTSVSENFISRNYQIAETRIKPKVSYLLNENVRFDLFYQYTAKNNEIGNLERLLQNNLGMGFTYNNAQKVALTGEINFFNNAFEGSANTPVSYQMLEGLQPGKNLTWSLLAQKKLTAFLDLNFNYFGRKTETSQTIHTGTIQLKAYF